MRGLIASACIVGGVFWDDLLSGHSSAQPLRTHELHGTALLTGGKRGR